MEQLGLHMDTRNMCTIYPLFKDKELLNFINEGSSVTFQHTQREIATLLEILWTASVILPL